MNEPIWLNKLIILAIHKDLIRQYGGLFGVRDEGLLEASLARPRHCFTYNSEVSLFNLAAAYGFAFCKNHAFIDGNKRVAFMAMYVFLGLNNFYFEAPEMEVVLTIKNLADGKISEEFLTEWLVKYATKKLNK